MPIAAPSTRNCSIAAGRRTSVETISGWRLRSFLRNRASFASVVVLPEPCKPTSMILTGGLTFRSSSRVLPPITSHSSVATN